jgi:hypothetical protein
MPTAREPERRARAAPLSVAACRRLLGPGCTLTDEEIETLRDQLGLLADAAIDAFLEAKDDG